MDKYRMMKPRKYILTILSFFCTLTIFAENKLAVINDPDGFTNVRSGQGREFTVIDTINKDEFFYCDPTEKGEWIKISVVKYEFKQFKQIEDYIEFKQVEGYIHRSRIQFFENLDYKKQKEIIVQILNKQRIIADNLHTASVNKDSIARSTISKELVLHHEIKYSPIIGILPKYFCSTNDIEVLQLFFATRWADRGSADERPINAIFDCFICKIDIVIEQLKKIKNAEQKEHILNDIEWLLFGYFNVEENGKSDNKEFNKLKSLLDNERKNASR